MDAENLSGKYLVPQRQDGERRVFGLDQDVDYAQVLVVGSEACRFVQHGVEQVYPFVAGG